MGSGIDPIREGDFGAEVATQEGKLRLHLTGNADVNVMPHLERMRDLVHAEALKSGVPSVVVDLRDLEFMNSSCLKCLVVWITQIQELPADKQYRLILQSSQSRYWQKRSLPPLSRLAMDVVRIES